MFFLISEYAENRAVVELNPDTRAQAVRALSNVRGEPNGAVRLVQLARTKMEDFIVRGPSDGRPLLIFARRGLPRLNVKSGRVVIYADSNYGNAVTVSGGADVTVVTTAARKVSATVEDNGRLHVDAAPASHGYLHTTSPAGAITATGEHRFTIRQGDSVTRS